MIPRFVSINLGILWCCITLGSLLTLEGSLLTPERLRCEFLENPLGIDTAEPRLSWGLRAGDLGQRGLDQQAYQILVASSPRLLAQGKPDLWDSGKVLSDETLGIVYSGTPLKSGQAAYWKVRVWSSKGLNDSAESISEVPSDWSPVAHFSIGLLEDTDWQARWITAPEFLSDSPKHIGYLSELTTGKEDPKWVQIDLGKTRAFDAIRLHPACSRRNGLGTPGGEGPPGDGFPARIRFEVADDAGFSNPQMVADVYLGESYSMEPQRINLEPAKGRFVRVTATAHRELIRYQGNRYCLKLAELEVLKGGENLAFGCSVDALDSQENISEGYGKSLLTDGRTGYDAGSRLRLGPAPIFRGEFHCGKPVRRAMAYATALGNYELFVNGQRVAEDCLAPGYTNYDRRVAVRAFDITSLIREGDNAAGAILGDGWYRSRYRLDGYGQYKDFAQGRFGDGIPRLLAQMVVEYEDGSHQVFGTGSGWSCSLDGPLRKTSMYDGVVYDARREIAGWSEPSVSPSGWHSAVVSNPDWNPVLWPQSVYPVERVASYEPVSIWPTDRGTWIADFGQGVGGVCRVTLDGPRGMTVSLNHAMALNPDGTLYRGSLWGAHDNADTYILKGDGPQTFEAPFTFHGFRFVEISGMASQENLKASSALMISDSCPPASELRTSDARLNKVWDAAMQAYLSCFKSAMVDVSDRDERWGWMGDCGTVHDQSMIYAFDDAAYYRKRMLDLVDDQTTYLESYFPPKSPVMRGGGPSAIWSDAALWISWAAWINYGDRKLLREIYPAIRAYVHLLQSNYEAGHEPWPFHFGDWLSSFRTIRPGADDWSEVGPEQIPKSLLQKLALLRNANLFRSIAEVMREEEEVAAMEKLASRLRSDSEVSALYRQSPETGAQTAYAFLLGWDSHAIQERKRIMAQLERAIEAYGNHPTTGTPSTTTLLRVLSENGRHDLAYHLALKPDFPSFGFMVENGATTLWERFDTYHPELGWNPEKMNSPNHMGFSSVMEWLFGQIGGIQPDPLKPAYKNVIIAPKLGGEVDSMEARYDSVRGPIESSYEIGDGRLTLRVKISPNTSATIRIPTTKPNQIRESNRPLSESPGVTLSNQDEEAAYVEVLSGRYEFSCPVSPL